MCCGWLLCVALVFLYFGWLLCVALRVLVKAFCVVAVVCCFRAFSAALGQPPPGRPGLGTGHGPSLIHTALL